LVAEPSSPPKALFFDVFGTCVDWRSGVAREGAALGRRLGLEGVDWDAMADAWRARYQPQLETVRSGRRPWTTLDVLHREALDDMLAELGLEAALGPADRDELTLAWHRLDPWPDAVAGLTSLRERFVVAPLSNGNVSLLVDMAKRAHLPWDAVLSAELFGHYKPDAEVYDGAARLLGLAPEQVLMVAAHADDLAAARTRGLRTAYVHRPHEFGPRATPPATDPEADLNVATLTDLAARLGPG
jgi:2-haloacid dehalogenase